MSQAQPVSTFCRLYSLPRRKTRVSSWENKSYSSMNWTPQTWSKRKTSKSQWAKWAIENSRSSLICSRVSIRFRAWASLILRGVRTLFRSTRLANQVNSWKRTTLLRIPIIKMNNQSMQLSLKLRTWLWAKLRNRINEFQLRPRLKKLLTRTNPLQKKKCQGKLS